MSFLFDSEFIEIKVFILTRIKDALPFDIYIRRAKNAFTKLYNRGDKIDAEQVLRYREEKNVESYFVQKDDYRQYLFYAEAVAHQIFENLGKVTPEELTDVLGEMVNLTMLEIAVKYHIDQKSIAQAAHTVGGCLKVLNKDPKQLLKIFRLVSRHPYVIKHSVTVVIFSILLAQKAKKIESEKNLVNLGLAALVHDVGMAQLSFDSELLEELTPEQWKEIKEHPQLGKKLLDSVRGLNAETKTIVLQHHEQPNGRGYPNGLYDKDIYFPAKIISIVDSFSSLTSNRPFRKGFPTLKALEIMHEDRGKFDDELLDEFSSLFVKVQNE